MILLSIGYARDSDGRFLQCFGPIAQEGGQRRLNVAVSRARKRMIVVSSVVAENVRSRPCAFLCVAGLVGCIVYAPCCVGVVCARSRSRLTPSPAPCFCVHSSNLRQIRKKSPRVLPLVPSPPPPYNLLALPSPPRPAPPCCASLLPFVVVHPFLTVADE